jgi:hypothetical protein
MQIKELIAVLTIVQSASGTNEPYNNILFSEDEIKAYNGNTGIVISYETGIEGAIPVDPLIKTLKSLRGNELEISPKKKIIAVKTDKDENIRLSPNKEVKKFFPFEYDEDEFDELPENFQDALGLCSLTTGGLVLKEFVQGVYFIDDEAVSTNDAAVSKVKMDEELEDNFFIHNNSISVLTRVVPFGIKIEKKRIVFDCIDDIQVVCPFYKDYNKFPYPYKKLMKDFEDEFDLPKDFHHAMKKANSTLHGSKTKLSQFEFKDGSLVIKTKNKSSGITLTDSIEIESDLKDNFYIDVELLSKYDFCKKLSINDTSIKLMNKELGVEVVVAKTQK